MEQAEIQRAIMAVLFAAGECVGAARLAQALECDVDEIHRQAQQPPEAPFAFPRHPVAYLKQDLLLMVADPAVHALGIALILPELTDGVDAPAVQQAEIPYIGINIHLG